MTKTPSPTLAARYAQGVKLRQKSGRQSHADLLGPADRDPVAILAAGDRTRIPRLIPIRYERMLTSPFAFLRGAAAVMAQDLRHQPSVGIAVQACGDCHLILRRRTFFSTSMISTRRYPGWISRLTSNDWLRASQ